MSRKWFVANLAACVAAVVSAAPAPAAGVRTAHAVVPPSQPCATASLVPANPIQAAGSTVAFTAMSSGCTNPQYEYWIQFPNGRWYPWRAFSTDPTWNLSTSGFSPGAYTVHVWANQAGNSTAAYEALASTTVRLTGCTSASHSPGSGWTKVGTSITFTATSTGCPNPVYEFWLQDTRGHWHLMRAFGSSTWTWKNAGWGKGVYHISVWANQQGAYTGRLEANCPSTHTLY